MNKIIIIGRLTRDPEMRNSQGGTAVCRYSVAVDRRFKRDGEAEADFFNCTAFGKGAEFAEKYLRKGTKVVVSGRMQSDNYTNKDGQKVYGWQLIVEEQEFAESKAAASTGAPVASRPSAADAGDGFVNIDGGIEEDLPFI